jgi:hypothetical protein
VPWAGSKGTTRSPCLKPDTCMDGCKMQLPCLTFVRLVTTSGDTMLLSTVLCT